MRDGKLKPPFPWFGSKTLVSRIVWEAIGNVETYIEPFAGSLAVLLARPSWHSPHREIVNDADCLIVNFWRGIKIDPESVAEYADWPISEADMVARREVIRCALPTLCDKIKSDPEFLDARLAGWWVWGVCGSFAGRFGRNFHRPEANMPARSKVPVGINRRTISDLRAYLSRLSERMRRVIIMCGDWTRAVSEPILESSRDVGVFLDPPYKTELRDRTLYPFDCQSVSDDVREWAIKVGDDPRMKVVLAGLEPEHAGKMPDTWTVVHWRARGGPVFKHAEVTNTELERLWLSPGCRLRAKELF